MITNGYFGQPRDYSPDTGKTPYEWGKVVEEVGWGYSEVYNGFHIREGEYDIRWPDGDWSVEYVRMDKSSSYYSEMGRIETYTKERPYIYKTYRGAPAFVYILGMDIRKHREDESNTRD